MPYRIEITEITAMDNSLNYQKYINSYLASCSEKEFYSHVGYTIRKLRIQNNYSQRKLADYLGISFQQIQKYEQGANRIPTRFIIKLMDLFKVDIHEILGQKDPNNDLREAVAKLQEKGKVLEANDEKHNTENKLLKAQIDQLMQVNKDNKVLEATIKAQAEEIKQLKELLKQRSK